MVHGWTLKARSVTRRGLKGNYVQFIIGAIERLLLAVCCLSPRQLLADSYLFSTEGMINNVRIREVYHSVCGSELLADRQRADI